VPSVAGLIAIKRGRSVGTTWGQPAVAQHDGGGHHRIDHRLPWRLGLATAHVGDGRRRQSRLIRALIRQVKPFNRAKFNLVSILDRTGIYAGNAVYPSAVVDGDELHLLALAASLAAHSEPRWLRYLWKSPARTIQPANTASDRPHARVSRAPQCWRDTWPEANGVGW